MYPANRRLFLRRATATTALGLPLISEMPALRSLAAAELELPADSVRFDDGIEPLIRFIEQTPRDQVIEKVAVRVREGQVSYRDMIAALLLAGIRNIQPRPSVGFKFHAVLVVHSAHLASLASPAADRWLPVFWALDNFKGSQARDVREGDWTMSTVEESAVPRPHQAVPHLRQALEDWNEAAADAAVAGLCRSHSSGTAFDVLAEFAARDFRSIGHKVIYLANSFRTLHTIGWQHAEPVLRSLVYAMLNHSGEPNPASSDLEADRDGRRNRQRVGEIREHWLDGKQDSAATAELLSALRDVSPDDASRLAVEQLNQGIAPQSIFDAYFAAAAELTMRQPAIVPLHAMTTTNAIHYAFQTCSDPATRQFLLLQNASFLARFRTAAQGRGKLADLQIDALTPVEGEQPPQLSTVFQSLGQNASQAAAQLLRYLDDGQPASDAMSYARRLIFLKGRDSHDYKYSSAVLEDFHAISPQWRNRYLAAALFKMRNENESTTSLVGRIRDAMRA
ncbi:hypothetical protein [Roseimaritima ulvae]|uniref:Uncharacterized protein n=1 Tax=Roseimaritima ulvae TaxID=980254 RepID=A0A5B9QRI2_9BACT|nr:hypothetical protein [Roseimaritima ulvae]QEG41638.1 hypothetical protein UC8_36640 [Roseimaritima ulvae]